MDDIWNPRNWVLTHIFSAVWFDITSLVVDDIWKLWNLFLHLSSAIWFDVTSLLCGRHLKPLILNLTHPSSAILISLTYLVNIPIVKFFNTFKSNFDSSDICHFLSSYLHSFWINSGNIWHPWMWILTHPQLSSYLNWLQASSDYMFSHNFCFLTSVVSTNFAIKQVNQNFDAFINVHSLIFDTWSKLCCHLSLVSRKPPISQT